MKKTFKTLDFLYENKDIPLHNAIKNQDSQSALSIIKNCKKSFVDYKICDFSDINAPCFVKLKNKYDSTNNLYMFISQNKTIFSQNKLLQSALHVAIQNKMLDVVKALLNKGFPTNSQDFAGQDALHFAAESGDEEIIQFISSHYTGSYPVTADGRFTPCELLPPGYYKDATLMALNPRYLSKKKENNNFSKLIKDSSKTDRDIVSLLNVNLIGPTQLDPLPSEIAKTYSREKLSKYLEYIEAFMRLNNLYTILIIKKRMSKYYYNNIPEDFDLAFLKLHFKLLNHVEKYSFDSDLSMKNCQYLYQSLMLISYTTEQISYDLRRGFSVHFPWNSIIGLSIALNPEGNYNNHLLIAKHMKQFVEKEVDELKSRIISIIEKKSEWYEKDDSDVSLSLDSKFRSLHYMTTPLVNGQECIEKLLFLIQNACLCKLDNKKNRYSFMSLLKAIGEQTKYTYLSQHLAVYFKTQFASFSWRALSNLRNVIAKQATKENQVRRYKELIDGNNNNLLFEVQAQLNDLKIIILNMQSSLKNQLGKPKSNLEKICFPTTIQQPDPLILNDEFKNELKNDVESIILNLENETNRILAINKVYIAKTKKLNKSEKNDLKKLSSLEKKFSEVKSTSNRIKALDNVSGNNLEEINNFFKNYAVTTNQKRKFTARWEEIKKEVENNIPFVKLINFIKKPYNNSALFNYYYHNPICIGVDRRKSILLRRAKELINDWMNAYIKDTDLHKNLLTRLESGDFNQKILTQLNQSMQDYREDIETRYAINQIYVDLFLIFDYLKFPVNKLFRNYIEHDNGVYRTAGREVNRASASSMVTEIAQMNDMVEFENKLLSLPKTKTLNVLQNEERIKFFDVTIKTVQSNNDSDCIEMVTDEVKKLLPN